MPPAQRHDVSVQAHPEAPNQRGVVSQIASPKHRAHFPLHMASRLAVTVSQLLYDALCEASADLLGDTPSFSPPPLDLDTFGDRQSNRQCLIKSISP